MSRTRNNCRAPSTVNYTWWPIPERDNLVGVGLGGHGLGPGQPKVRQLELAPLVDEQVLRLEVAVEDAARVTVRQAA